MNWDDPLDPIAITVDEIVSGSTSTLLVMHEEGHGGWQFYDGSDLSNRQPLVVPKEELLAIDPTLIAVTDLPVGRLARRENVGGAWDREEIVPN